MDIIELFDIEGLDNIALVSRPAIGVNFLCFSEDEKPMRFHFTDDERRIVTGPFLIPDLQMLRYKESGEPYKVFFSKETVERLSREFLSNRQFNIGHSVDTDKVELVESWIKTTEQDKSTALGLDVPVGTWLGSVHISDDILWNEIKEGKFNGFSVAGYFSGVKSQDFAAQEDSDTMLLNQIRNLIEQCDE